MKSYDEFRSEVRALKQERWAGILDGEAPGRRAGRRPRDPEQERFLTELDRARVSRSELLRNARREPVSDDD